MIVCENCGKVIFEGTIKCPSCKAVINQSQNVKFENINDYPISNKSRLTAGLLQIFLGFVGAGRFYTGHWEIALIQMFLSIIGIGYIWAIVDGILILTKKLPYDSKHNVLK